MILTQIWVYTRKFFRTQKKDSLVAIIIGIVISAVVVWITGEDMFETFESTKSGFFSLVSACIWIGIFNSIQLICREKRDIVKDELDKGLHASAYIAAHFIFQMALCLVQSVIVFLICWTTIDFPTDGLVFSSSAVEYFITIFLLLYASDALALIISALVPTPVMAMTIMPLVLIMQLVMCGVLFELSDTADLIANITISKWGMAAMGSIGGLNDNSALPSKLALEFPNLIPDREAADIYEATSEHLWEVWLILLVFVIASYAISVVSLKLTTRILKK